MWREAEALVDPSTLKEFPIDNQISGCSATRPSGSKLKIYVIKYVVAEIDPAVGARGHSWLESQLALGIDKKNAL